MTEAERERVARSPYIAIMDAAKQGRGVRLTADECWDLHLDDAISTRAEVERKDRAHLPTPA